MATVKIIEPFEDAQNYEFEGPLGSFLYEKYDTRPEWQIFRDGKDITSDLHELFTERVGKYEVYIWAGVEISLSQILTGLLFSVASYGISALLRKGTPALENQRLGSSNNSLTARTNTERPLQRIEDIYGQVRSYPTLISVPYREYIDNDEYEFAYMCVGRGYFDISDVRDSNTLLTSIDGAGAAFYDPFTSPNNGLPSLSVGTTPTADILDIIRSNSVDGGTLLAPNELSHQGDGDVTFTTNKTISQSGDTVFTDFLAPGDQFTVTNSSSNDGTYTVATVNATTITITGTSISNESNSDAVIQKVDAADDVWLGPFILEDIEEVWCNIVAPAGIFKQKTKFENQTVTGTVEIQEVDETDTPINSAETFNFSFTAKSQDAQRKTVKCDPTFSGRVQVRVSRTSNTDYGYEGTVVDEIKWQDLYGVKAVTATDFGDVTTVHTITKATDSALRVKDRKFNCLAYRKLPDYSTGSASGTLYATKNIAPILCHMATDDRIGRRAISEVDYLNLYDTQAAIISYFGRNEAAEFSYTFDKDNITFEEMVQTVSEACFSLAYRTGSKLRLFFEKAQSASMMLFNHRNKIADSENRQVTFTASKEYDGVEISWRDPDNFDSDEIYRTNENAINPKKIQGVGLRNQYQAFWRAWREQNKIDYGRIRSEFTSTGEGRALIPGYRIDNIDNTRSRTTDGYVTSYSGVNLGLSQPHIAAGTHYINIMGHDGTVEIVQCERVDDYNIILASSPSSTIYPITENAVEPTRYIITTVEKQDALPFVVESVSVKDLYTTEISAINYSSNYYIKDTETP